MRQTVTYRRGTAILKTSSSQKLSYVTRGRWQADRSDDDTVGDRLNQTQ